MKYIIYKIIPVFILLSLFNIRISRGQEDIQWIGAWPHGPINEAVLKGAICYVGAGGELEVWDVSNLAQPVKLKSIFTRGIIMDLKIQKNFLYVAAGCDGVHIFDVSNPKLPQKISSIASQDWALSTTTSRNCLYMADDDAGLRILDISNPHQPIEISRFSTQEEAQAIFVYKDYAYLACDDGLYILGCNAPY